MTLQSKTFRYMEFAPLILELIQLYEPQTYVEIGTQKGYTFNQIAQMPQIKRAVAVDIKIEKAVLKSRYKTEHYEMTSLEFAKIWKDPIDLLFIDGDHRWESVLNDFRALTPFVPSGHGLILLHDTHPATKNLMEEGYCFNAWRAAVEIHESSEFRDFEIVTLPGPYAGLSIVRKVSEGHLAWRTGKWENGYHGKRFIKAGSLPKEIHSLGDVSQSVPLLTRLWLQVQSWMLDVLLGIMCFTGRIISTWKRMVSKVHQMLRSIL